jgi:DNA repair photolyase
VFLRDRTKTIIARNDSPDVGFDASVNPYRGCEHGCIYCFARPTHEYLGFSAGLDFETRIMVKMEAPALLREELSSKKWKPQVLAMSGVTDCYQPIERKLQLTRQCLQVLAEFRNPVCIITKNHLVTRDIDIYKRLAEHDGVAINISVTSLDETLAQRLEPRASLPAHRLRAIEALSKAGISVGVLVAPVIPAITDFELPGILKAAVSAGAQFAGYVPLRLPYGVSDLFQEWLTTHFPDRKEKVLSQIRGLREGRLNDPDFGSRMTGTGPWAERLSTLFAASARKAVVPEKRPSLGTEHFRRPAGRQLSLF